MIQSFPIPNVTNKIQHLIYDTVLNKKHVFTACGIGVVENNDAKLTPTGQDTLFALAENVDNLWTIRFWEIKKLSRAKARVRTAIESARDKDAIFFVCHDSQIYDAVVAAPHVNWVSSETEH